MRSAQLTLPPVSKSPVLEHFVVKNVPAVTRTVDIRFTDPDSKPAPPLRMF